MRGQPPPGSPWRSHHPAVGSPASLHGPWGWRRFPWWCRGVAICDCLFPSPLKLSKKNKKGVVCMGRLASPSLGYGFLLFLAGVAADSSACPDLASFFLLFFFLEEFHPDPSAETPSLAVGDRVWSFRFFGVAQKPGEMGCRWLRASVSGEGTRPPIVPTWSSRSVDAEPPPVPPLPPPQGAAVTMTGQGSCHLSP